jgi:signal-transduction protein with cAMP-binding, CBS, and nucleotidyltransferase domain
MKQPILKTFSYAVLLLSGLMLLFPWELQAAECSEAVAVVKSYYQNLKSRKVSAALTKWETTTKQLKNKLSATRIKKLNRAKLVSCDEETGVAQVAVNVTAMTGCGRGQWRGTFNLNLNEDDEWKITSRHLKRYQRAWCSCS